MADSQAPSGSAAPVDPERHVDGFIPLVGVLGLGLVAFLVYIYWL